MKQEEFYLNQLDRECIKIPGKGDKYLLRNNFLNEYYTDKDKAKVLSNLGITPLLERLEALVKAKLVDEAGNLRFGLKPTSYKEDPNALVEVLSSDTIYNTLQQYYTKEEIDEWRERVFDTINFLRDLVGSLNNHYTREQVDFLLSEKVYTRDLHNEYYSKYEVDQLINQLKNYIDNNSYVFPSNETVVEFNITDIENPTKILGSASSFRQITIDGNIISQDSLVEGMYYQFDSLGKHIIKYISSNNTDISDNAFEGCDSITSIIISNEITRIGEDAFKDCTNLVSIIISESVSDIAVKSSSGVFNNCNSLISIIVNNNNSTYDSRSNCNAIIEKNSNALIAGCKNTVIPNTVTEIRSYAFAYCNGLLSITIPESVTNIQSVAFYFCESMREICLESETPPNRNSNMFHYTNSCPIYVPCNSIDAYKSAWPDYYTDRIYCKNDSQENHNIVIATFNITEANTPVSIVANDRLGMINRMWIDGVEHTDFTEEISFSEARYVEIRYEFVDSTVMPDALATCDKLFSIVIPEGVTSIKYNAFRACESLTYVTIPNSVTSIEGYAFMECSNLASINIPNNITTIEDYTFYRSGLTSVSIPNSVTTIGMRAFGETPLTSVEIGDGVTSIEKQAFKCSNLDSIRCSCIVAPTIESSTFSVKNTGTLYVPSPNSGYNTWMQYLGQSWTKVEQ